uniref:Orfan n=1 Tax=Strongyloides venezuelensis TaxID=75913 RepID=A0A0K0FIR9_STRVS
MNKYFILAILIFTSFVVIGARIFKTNRINYDFQDGMETDVKNIKKRGYYNNYYDGYDYGYYGGNYYGGNYYGQENFTKDTNSKVFNVKTIYVFIFFTTFLGVLEARSLNINKNSYNFNDDTEADFKNIKKRSIYYDSLDDYYGDYSNSSDDSDSSYEDYLYYSK